MEHTAAREDRGVMTPFDLDIVVVLLLVAVVLATFGRIA
jgi:hypothetical protein